MQIGYLYIRPVEALCVRSTGPYKLSAAQAWDTMLAWLDERALRACLTRGYGVIHDNPATTEPHLRRYDACIEVPADLPAEPACELARCTVPGGAYVVHRHVGRHRTIGAGFSYVQRKWVPGHGLRVDPRRPYLEIYLNDPATTPASDLLTDVCVPVIPVADLVTH